MVAIARRLWFGWRMRALLIAAVWSVAEAALAAEPLAFTPRVPIPVAVGEDAGPQAVALADVSGDGITDMVIVGRDDDVIHILLGAGDGTFADPVDYEIDGTPTAVAVADVASPFASDTAGDADGTVDVIVADEDGFAEILLGRGDGTFDPPEQDLSDALDALELIGVEVRDLDQNGRLDLIFLDAYDEVYFLCNEAGVFAPCATDYVETGGETAIDFAVTDFDLDGNLDVAVLSIDSHDVRVIRGLGGTTFEETPTYVFEDTGGLQVSAALQAAPLDDVGGDELVIASAGPADRAVAVIAYAQPDSTVSSLPGVGNPIAIAIADYDGDTILDLATIAGAAPVLTIARGDGSAGFAAPVVPADSASLGVGRTLVAGNIDGDALPDLAVVNDAGDAVQVLLNATAAAPACAGDCNGDGTVVINELLTGVNIAIGLQPVTQCVAFDANGSSGVEINELIAAVRDALEGCAPVHPARDLTKSPPAGRLWRTQ
jgi:hypothetical protein